jgi:hypothetical protein
MEAKISIKFRVAENMEIFAQAFVLLGHGAARLVRSFSRSF